VIFQYNIQTYLTCINVLNAFFVSTFGVLPLLLMRDMSQLSLFPITAVHRILHGWVKVLTCLYAG